MAGVQERGGNDRVYFCCQGKQETFPLGKVTKQEAEAKVTQVEYLVLRLKQKLVQLPPGVSISEFLRHDGAPPLRGSPATKNANIGMLRDRFLANHEGALEKNTLYTARIHFTHAIKTLGKKFPLAELAQADLQRHIDRWASEGIAPVTIKKEITGIRAAWNWGKRGSLVSAEWQGRGLVYRKGKEKPPFQTRTEIERKIAKGGDPAELWECLYLTVEELADFCLRPTGRMMRC